MSKKILTLHPDPAKKGVNLDQEKYDQIKSAILESIREAGEIPFMNGLIPTVVEKLQGKFDGSVGWYVTTIKLDLEARGLIERVPGKSPQRLQLK